MRRFMTDDLVLCCADYGAAAVGEYELMGAGTTRINFPNRAGHAFIILPVACSIDKKDRAPFHVFENIFVVVSYFNQPLSCISWAWGDFGLRDLSAVFSGSRSRRLSFRWRVGHVCCISQSRKGGSLFLLSPSLCCALLVIHLLLEGVRMLGAFFSGEKRS